MVHAAQLDDGPNLEARARAERQRLLPPEAMTGHTADDQAETVLFRLLRGSGTDGLAAMTPGDRHPILALRRADTLAVCAAVGAEPLTDPTNRDSRFRRNRIRHELLPLASELMDRDVVPILTRTADHLRDDAAVLDQLADQLDPHDALGLGAAHPALARRALRRWLTADGYPPDTAAIERVYAVAIGASEACDVGAGIRVERSGQRLRIARTQR